MLGGKNVLGQCVSSFSLRGWGVDACSYLLTRIRSLIFFKLFAIRYLLSGFYLYRRIVYS